MICPYCQTDNRDDREACYYCAKDLSMLRLIVNKAKHHYNQALEHAERGHLDDAIAELKNALDLDSTMAGACVVLGTLYAKKEMFAEARESWQRALALDHHFEKAHEYLHKAEKAEYIFPAMKRLKWVSAALGGTLLVALIAIILLSVAARRPSPGLLEAHQVTALLRTGDPAQVNAAQRQATELAKKKDAAPLVREMATELKESIQVFQTSAQQDRMRAQRELQERITLAANAIGNDGPYAALQIADSMEDKKQDEAIRQSIRRVRDRAIREIIRNVNESADDFNAGTLPYERFKIDAERFLKLYPAGPEHDAVAKRLEQADVTNRERLLAEATAAITKAPLAEAARKVADWGGLYPDFRAPLRSLLDQRVAAESSKLRGDITALLAQGQFDRARQKEEELDLLYHAAQRPEPKELLDGIKGEIGDAERHAALAAAQDAYAKKNWEEFIKLTADPARLASDKIERDKLAGMRGEASQAFAVQMWDWFQKRDTKFEDGRITPEEAARAVQTHAAVMDNLPGNLGYARAPILYYTALCCVKLGETERARELIEQVRQRYPKSQAARGANRLLKSLDAGKAPPAEPKAEPNADPKAAKAESNADPKTAKGEPKGNKTEKAAKADSKTNKAEPKPDKAGKAVKAEPKSKPKTEQQAEPKPAQKTEDNDG